MTGLLIFVGLILIILNVLSIKKQSRSFNGMLGDAMGNIQDYDIEIGELRREFSEGILKLQSEIMDMKEIMAKNNEAIRNCKTYQNRSNDKTIINDTKREDDNNKIIIDEPNQDLKHEIVEDDPRQDIKDELVSEELDNMDNTSNIDETRNESSAKVEEIKRLFGEGMSMDEISEILHLGKGEVLLIKDLYIR